MKVNVPPSAHRYDGIVYFARLGDEGPIKIGCSYSLKTRLYEIRRNGKAHADALALVKGGHSLEARFHAYFEPIHLGREWFEPEPVLLDAIAALNADTFDFDRLPATGWCVTKPFQCRASLAHWGPLPRFDKLELTPGRIAA